MEPNKAVKFVERLLDAQCLLSIWGLLSDAETARVKRRIDKWALKHGLKRREGGHDVDQGSSRG